VSTKLEFYFDLEFTDMEFSEEMFEEIHEIGVRAFEDEFGPLAEFQGFGISGINFGTARQYGKPGVSVLFIDNTAFPYWREITFPIETFLFRCAAFVNKVELCMYQSYPELDPRITVNENK
jgi:hypothetical protein